MKEIPTNSLLTNYLPTDYLDSFSRIVTCDKAITTAEFLDLAFKQFPKWIELLLKLRNTIVKPLGLDTKSRFTDMISAQNSNEIIFGMPDKHLDFHVSLFCGDHKDGKQELSITTIVKYNNWFGKVYFFFIRPFHGIIISSILKSIAAKLKTEKYNLQ